MLRISRYIKGMLQRSIYLPIIMLLFVPLLLSGCKEVLYSEIPERDINMMVMILEKNGITARRQSNGDNKYSLVVEETDFTRAVDILASKGYPKKQFKSFGDIFSNDGIVKTPFEQRARFMHALNQELSQSLSEIQGVVTARVHVMIPETTRFGTAKQKTSASVMIMHTKTKNLHHLIPKIKQFVSNSVSGVGYENVSVVMLPLEGIASEHKEKVTPKNYNINRHISNSASLNSSSENVSIIKASIQYLQSDHRNLNLLFFFIAGLFFLAAGLSVLIAIFYKNRKVQ